MADETRTPDNPRAPEHQEWTGTGTPRSADDGLAQPAAYSAMSDADESVVTGMESTAQPAHADEADINRSGSGGSGGPVTGGEDLEGSTPASMSELLSGDEDTMAKEDSHD